MAEVDRPELFNQVLMLLALLIVTGLGLSVAGAQTSSGATATSGSGQYYFEFRSRQAWDYGHTFVVFGRVGEPPSKKNVAGLSPKGPLLTQSGPLAAHDSAAQLCSKRNRVSVLSHRV